MTRLAYHQSDLVVDLSVGLWAWPMPMDWDGDGDLDLIVSCPDKPYNGCYFFENTGNDEPFKPGIRVHEALRNAQVSYVDGRPRVLTPGREYTDFLGKKFDNSQSIYPTSKLVTGKTRANQWKYIDFDGDGVLDLSVGVGEWTDYGWDNAFNHEGVWTNGPLHGWVFIIRNTGTNDQPDYAPPFKVQAGGKPVDVYGMPSPNFADFDQDGDLDLICGEFLDGFTWFENTGSRTKPSYKAGQRLGIQMDLQMITPTAVDWDNDGDIDMICGDEDGRVAYLENLGITPGGIPHFSKPNYLKQEASDVKFGALVTPFGVDWDGDGDDDIIAGNTAGYIGFIENLSNQQWAPPVCLEAAGKIIRIQAGMNGSIQGPCEAKWGYTTLSVADWDHDGNQDIIANSIWGKIVWYRNTGDGKLATAQPVRYAGTAPKPSWNWWEPAPGEFISQWRTTPVVIDWNSDGLNDLVMLDHEGYLALFERNSAGSINPGQRIFHDHAGPIRLSRGDAGKSGRRKLCVTDWDNDGDLDFLINSVNANLLRNISEKNGTVRLRDDGPLGNTPLAGHTSSPTMIDIDGDGEQELMVGAEDGYLYVTKKKKHDVAIHRRGDLSLLGAQIRIEVLQDGGLAFSNRRYVWENLPSKYRGWNFTMLAGGQRSHFRVKSESATTLFLASAPSLPKEDLAKWDAISGHRFNYTDKGKSVVQVYQRSIQAGEEVIIPQGNWTGGMLLLPNLERKATKTAP